MANQLTTGQLIAFTSLLTYFTTPLESLINLQTKLQSAQVACQRLNDILVIKPEDNKNILTRKFNLNGHIELKNISLNIDYGKSILQNINITVKTGEKISIVGPSGSGKSSLAKLLVNFFDHTSGSILINDINIKEIPKETLRQHILYVTQETYLFKGTIKENLTTACRKNVTDDEIIMACKLSNIYEDILKLPLGFNTEIADDSGLSGGQKQRIAIARAFLMDSPVLILDEATSGIDSLTESKIIDNLLQLKNKTIIFIAHRLSISKNADRILVLKEGSIIELGTHEKLTNRKSSFYQKLFDLT